MNKLKFSSQTLLINTVNNNGDDFIKSQLFFLRKLIFLFQGLYNFLSKENNVRAKGKDGLLRFTRNDEGERNAKGKDGLLRFTRNDGGVVKCERERWIASFHSQ